VELPTPNVPIINNAFTKSGDFAFTGSFTGPQQAQGTVSNSDSQCTTGEDNWTASTTALPPPPPVLPFKFGPSSGGTNTTFTVQFTAGLNEHGTTDFYIVDISGPQGCRDVEAFTTEDATAGQLVTLRVDPSGITPLGKARQWCVGDYSGSVYFCYCAPNDPRPNVPVGRFGFAVRGPANYSGNTSQDKSIRFTLSATGTRITPPRTDIRFTCRYPGAPPRKFTLPLSPQSDATIPLRNGTFTVSQSFNPQGARDNLEITGRLAGGTFQGKMRYHGSGHGVSCDSGSVTWSAR
jgi:hypothetical protein